MTEFKQIIGRGTRIDEDYDKHWFTIMDFKKATELFADKDFDGDPVQVYDPKPDDSVLPPDDDDTLPDDDDRIDGSDTDGTGIGDDDDGVVGEGRIKYHIKGEAVSVISERVQYLGADGKLITESMRDLHPHDSEKAVYDYGRLSSQMVRCRQEAGGH